MKKVLFVGALLLSVSTFANNKETTNITEKEKKVQVIEKKKIAILLASWWKVSYVNSCGTVNTVYFQSDYADGSPEFNRELAFAVNSSFDVC